MAVLWSLGRCPLSGRWATGTVNSSVSQGPDSSAGRTSVSAPQVSRWTPPLGNAKVCKDHPMLLISVHILMFVPWYIVYIYISVEDTFAVVSMLEVIRGFSLIPGHNDAMVPIRGPGNFWWKYIVLKNSYWFLRSPPYPHNLCPHKNYCKREHKFKYSKCGYHLSIKKEHI